MKQNIIYYNLLENSKIIVTSGRDSSIDVGMFLTGGGISYHTGRNGFGCDTVNFEAMLVNGNIIEANTDKNPALQKALKGSSLDFGIVACFNLQANPAVDLAIRQSIISSNYSNKVINTMVQFTS